MKKSSPSILCHLFVNTVLNLPFSLKSSPQVVLLFHYFNLFILLFIFSFNWSSENALGKISNDVLIHKSTHTPQSVLFYLSGAFSLVNCLLFLKSLIPGFQHMQFSDFSADFSLSFLSISSSKNA